MLEVVPELVLLCSTSASVRTAAIVDDGVTKGQSTKY